MPQNNEDLTHTHETWALYETRTMLIFNTGELKVSSNCMHWAGRGTIKIMCRLTFVNADSPRRKSEEGMWDNASTSSLQCIENVGHVGQRLYIWVQGYSLQYYMHHVGERACRTTSSHPNHIACTYLTSRTSVTGASISPLRCTHSVSQKLR